MIIAPPRLPTACGRCTLQAAARQRLRFYRLPKPAQAGLEPQAPAPRGRCACGLENSGKSQPVPRPLLDKTSNLSATCCIFKLKPWNRLCRATGGRPPRGAAATRSGQAWGPHSWRLNSKGVTLQIRLHRLRPNSGLTRYGFDSGIADCRHFWCQRHDRRF